VNINEPRLFDSIAATARVGALAGGGVSRMCLTPPDIELRKLVSRWLLEAGLAVRRDAIGNVFARREGDRALEPIAVGSHLDSQILAGPYDGALGVLAALEVVRALDDADVRTQRPIEVVIWLGEEGARFAPPMLGSSVWAGTRSLATALATRDRNGVTLADALAADELAGVARDPPPSQLAAYFELHIEQGPLLDRQGDDLGIVAAACPARACVLELRGETGHAGPPPMATRRNAAVAAAEVAVAVDHLGRQKTTRRSTVTRLDVSPGLAGIIPDHATIALDYRSTTTDDVNAMGAALDAQILAIARRHGVDVATTASSAFGDDVVFDPALASLVEDCASSAGVRHRRMPSYAGHDAYIVAGTCPVALLFVPCVDGVTHNVAEMIEPARIVPGVQVLLDAVCRAAT
jgi:beta-ureidopropionase / N-carbamoyl-L-amino-acid hydrolase